MQGETHYDLLGLSPNASHSEVLKAFARVAAQLQQRSSDPTARERLQQVKDAYQILTSYDSRLRYNIERGLPDPPRHARGAGTSNAFEDLSSLIPGNWHVWGLVLAYLVLQFALLFEGQWMWEQIQAFLP
jgi:curved DNA-binding protein CbpA